MKSIKPGRGPSFMGGIFNVIGIVFGVLWMGIAIYMDAFIMIPFGLLFIAVAVFNAIYNFKNATGKNRYSQYDIVDEDEESDPFNERFGIEKRSETPAKGRYCPWCGAKNEDDYRFCKDCGKELP